MHANVCVVDNYLVTATVTPLGFVLRSLLLMLTYGSKSCHSSIIILIILISVQR